jgi:ribose transport system ATP-binding protein
MGAIVLEARQIVKSFPGVKAVQNFDLTIRAGEVHCLVGENGAGKSTMIKILSGEYHPDAGTLLVDGTPVHFASPLDARRAGISVIHQELQLVPALSVAENIVLGRWPTAGGFTDRAAMRRIAAAVLPRVGLDIDPGITLSRLSIGQQQLVEIAQSRRADLLALGFRGCPPGCHPAAIS